MSALRALEDPFFCLIAPLLKHLVGKQRSHQVAPPQTQQQRKNKSFSSSFEVDELSAQSNLHEQRQAEREHGGW